MNWLKPPIKIKFKRLDVGQDFTNVCQSEYEVFFYTTYYYILHILMILNLHLKFKITFYPLAFVKYYFIFLGHVTFMTTQPWHNILSNQETIEQWQNYIKCYRYTLSHKYNQRWKLVQISDFNSNTRQQPLIEDILYMCIPYIQIHVQLYEHMSLSLIINISLF